ncbi:MAG: hypothetical protein R2867_07375 [Caldilineaceae bacterium]
MTTVQSKLLSSFTIRFARFLFWRRWVLANAVAELIGLGGSALLWIAFLFGMEAQLGILISAIVVVVGSTLLEGTAVGWLQWRMLRQYLPQLSFVSWWWATALGALVAWTLGMIPSTLMALSEEATAATGPPAEISDLLMYTLAAVMGFVLGPVLGTPQWWVLRRHLSHAWRWILANAVAWAAGMVVIFIAIGLVPEDGITALTVVILLGGLALAGAVVGAIHGAVLVMLLTVNRKTVG